MMHQTYLIGSVTQTQYVCIDSNNTRAFVTLHVLDMLLVDTFKPSLSESSTHNAVSNPQHSLDMEAADIFQARCLN